jgi:enamine deaminase RidA (YjgF/YER057c/UK114 family)
VRSRERLVGVRVFNPEGIVEVPGVSLVAVGTGSRLVAVAGQVGRDVDGTWTEGLVAQFAKALSNLSIALASAGASTTDLLKMTVYVVGWREDMGGALLEGAVSFAEAGGIIDPPSAWTLVGVQGLYEDRCLVEVDALAMLD